MIWKFVEGGEPNTLVTGKMNQALIGLFDMPGTSIDASKTNIWQNLRVLLSIVNENVSISFEIQAHQNANPDLIDLVVARYPAVWSETG